MKRPVLVANVLFLVVVVAVQASLFAQSPAEQIDTLINAYARLNKFSGTVLVARNGTVLLSKGYGLAQHEHRVPNTPQTIFRIGSLTKQFTAAAIMQLQERGLLSVRDPLSKFLPGYPRGESITLHHLLTHSSGIAEFTAGQEYLDMMRNETTVAQTITSFRNKPAVFQPGERFEYCNSNYVLLTAVIESVAKMSYADYIRTAICEPLGMNSTGYDVNADIVPGRAQGYRGTGDLLYNAEFIDMSVPAGAGGLYSTTEDLYTWTRALFGGRVVSRATLDAMITPDKEFYGYGLAIHNEPHRRIQHAGGINGFTTFLSYYPAEDICIVVLSNFEHAEPAEIKKNIAAILFGEPYTMPQERRAIALDAVVSRRYIGEYQLAPTFAIAITMEGDRVFAQATGQNRLELFPMSQTRFFLKVVDAEIEFTTGDDGAVTGLVLHQNGRSMPGLRVK